MSWPGWLCNWLHDGGWKHAGYSPQDWCKAQVGMQPSFYDLFHPQVLEHGSEALRFSATGFYSWCSDMRCMNPSVAWGTYSTVYGERNSQRVLLEPSIQHNPTILLFSTSFLANNSQSSYPFAPHWLKHAGFNSVYRPLLPSKTAYDFISLKVPRWKYRLHRASAVFGDLEWKWCFREW